MQNQKKARYSSLDGLRAIAALGVVVLHVKQECDYEITGFWYQRFVSSLTHLPLLFMIISGFCMCCGYYEKIKENRISLTEFYTRRYQRVWPYFALLVVMDLLLGFSKEALIEAFADLTLTYALLPNYKMSILGVAWTLGVIFLFYILFPFFCFLIKDKRTAWFTLAVTTLYQVVCVHYFMDSAHVVAGYKAKLNILYCAVYFVAGGIIYLYREAISTWVAKYRWGVLGIFFVLWVLYYRIPFPEEVHGLWLAVFFALLLCYAIGTDGKVLNNKGMHFVGDISMEIYLCHFGILRIAEKIGLKYWFGNGVTAYLFTCLFTIVGAVTFSACAKKVLYVIGKRIERKRV